MKHEIPLTGGLKFQIYFWTEGKNLKYNFDYTAWTMLNDTQQEEFFKYIEDNYQELYDETEWHM